MNVLRISSSCIVAALLAISVAVGFNKAAALQLGPPNAVAGVEVLTRGPVHEAFAETVTFDPQPTTCVSISSFLRVMKRMSAHPSGRRCAEKSLKMSPVQKHSTNGARFGEGAISRYVEPIVREYWSHR